MEGGNQIPNGVAPIKKEFLCSEQSKTSVEQHGIEESKELDDDKASRAVIKSEKRKGRNKKRPRDAKANYADSVCRQIAQGRSCAYGDKCKFNHDVQDYLRRKAKDIGDKCYLFETFGECPTGLTCRFGSSHIQNENGVVTNIRKPEAKGVPEPLNVVPDEIKLSLRKNNYPFRCQRKDRHGKKLQQKREEAKKEELKSANIANSEASKDMDLEGGKELQGEESKQKMNGQANPSIKGTESGKATPDQLPQEGRDPGNKTDKEVKEEQTPPESEKATREQAPQERLDPGDRTDKEVKKVEGPGTIPPLRKLVDFRGKVYIAPLTTVGNLPFRRIMKQFGADITCSEMAMAANLLTGQRSEWALMKRHSTEDVFGVQIAGSHPDQLTRIAQVIEENIEIDFMDLNLGCPIDLVCDRGSGSALMLRTGKLSNICRGIFSELRCPLTVKMRTGWSEKEPVAHKVTNALRRVVAECGNPNRIATVMIHGRSRLQRYTKTADWSYISSVEAGQHQSQGDIDPSEPSKPILPVIGNGDILSWSQWEKLKAENPGLVDCTMLGRGALIKPWLPTEIKEKRDWDISASERLEIFQEFVNFGLEHWGSDQQGVNTTRRFLLEWISFTHRYIPVGLLERLPQQINERPYAYFGRNDLETLMASNKATDWVRLSEMLLGPVPEGFRFAPKHKANAYAK